MDETPSTDTHEVLLEITPILSINVICRLCANPNDRIIGIYSEEGISNDLANKMNLYLPIKVSENDTLPLQCCWSCASTVLAWHELVLASVEADRRLRNMDTSCEKQIESNDEFENMGEPTSPMSSPATPTTSTDRSKEDFTASSANFKKDDSVKLEKDVKIEMLQAKSNQSDNESSLNESLHYKDSLEESTNQKLKCNTCNASFKRHCNLVKHMQSHDDNRPTRIEPFLENKSSTEICTTKAKYKIEIKMYTKKLVCDICNREFKRKADLNHHLQNDHGKNGKTVRRFRRSKNEIVAQFFCDVCGKGFTRKFDMQKHRKSKHPVAPEPQQEEKTQQQINLELLNRCKIAGDNNTNFYKCEICSRVFRQSYNFMRHQTVHTGIRAYFCHICGKNFRVSGGLYRHIQEHHLGVKKYKCEVCNKSFAAKATRDDHRNIHSDARPFVCDICGKAFRQKASLHIHKLFHSNNYRFTCNVCGKKYRRASELKIHSWLHTGHKPHECTMCDARFRLRQDLKRHIKVHDKLNECVCNECGSVFTQDRYLRNHKKTHGVKSGVVGVRHDIF